MNYNLVPTITCALHYFAIIPFLFKNRNKNHIYETHVLENNYCNTPFYYHTYINTIILSTTAGIIWHYYGNYMIFDYLVASLWIVQDVIWSFEKNKFRIIILNIIIFILNIISNFSNDYILYHSLWHIISACKCVYISYLIKY